MSVSNNVVFFLDIPLRSVLGCKVSREYSSVYMSPTLFEYNVSTVVAYYQLLLLLLGNTFRIMDGVDIVKSWI